MDPQLADQAVNDFSNALQIAGFLNTEAEAEGRRWTGLIEVFWQDGTTQDYTHAQHVIEVGIDEAFPYTKPFVIPRDEPQLVGQRHQLPFGDGALCLWPDDGLGWEPGMTAQNVLDRVREWFTHFHKDDWPESDRPPDLHLYFPNDGPHKLMLIGEAWAPPEEKQWGRFLYTMDSRRAMAVGAGPSLLTSEDLTDPTLRWALGISTQLSYRTGIWFRLKREPKPYPLLADMMKEIDQAAEIDPGVAISQLKGVLGERPKAPSGSVVIALGYPDTAGEARWLFLGIDVTENATTGAKVFWSTQSAAARIPVRAFATASVASEALMRRAGPVATELAGKNVLIFGVGAIGSTVALQLAKAGVGRLHLVDSDLLRPGNVVRHAAGLTEVGKLKTAATHAEIARHAPNCQVTSDGQTWHPSTLAEWVANSDIVVDATATEAFSLLLNDISVRVGTPVIFATAYRRAKVGQIKVVRPRRDACLVCHLAHYKMTHRDYPEIPRGSGEEFVEEGCGVPTVEAPAYDVDSIAIATARLAMLYLRESLGEFNHFLIVNEVIPEAGGFLGREGTQKLLWSPVDSCQCCSDGVQ